MQTIAGCMMFIVGVLAFLSDIGLQVLDEMVEDNTNPFPEWMLNILGSFGVGFMWFGFGTAAAGWSGWDWGIV